MWVLLASAAAAYGTWRELPGTRVDRTAFSTVASRFVEPPLFVEGRGTLTCPWELRSLTVEKKPDLRQAPVLVTLGDDLEGFFQASPPAPIDLAVVLKNIQRLGARKAATAVVMAWEAPDPIGLAALERALAVFDSLVLAAPLSRGVECSPLPPAFRRASLAASSLAGDALALPAVNRVPISGVVMTGENSLAGFSQLESEPASGFAPLMALWDDRVVFSFPLLVVMQRLGLPVAGMEVRLGEFLKLSPSGPIVRIDPRGRLVQPLKPLAGYAEISAQALINGGDDLFPTTAPEPVILCDTRSTAESRTRAFTASLAATVATLASDEAHTPRRLYPRLAMEWEIGVLTLTVLLLTLGCAAGDFWRHIGVLILAGGVCGAQWLGVGVASLWLPGLPLLAAISAATVFSKLVKIRQPASSHAPAQVQTLGPMPVPALMLKPRASSASLGEIPATPEPPPGDAEGG
jgi:hypothetical protein